MGNNQCNCGNNFISRSIVIDDLEGIKKKLKSITLLQSVWRGFKYRKYKKSRHTKCPGKLLPNSFEIKEYLQTE